MGGKFADMKAFIQKKAEQASEFVTSFVAHENTKATVAWSKEAAHTATREAVKLGKRVANSEMGKDAATGAAFGAVVAVPIPIVGPIIGAVVGAGIGVAMNLKSDGKKSSAPSAAPSVARESGYTALQNPCQGVRSFREIGRSRYVTDDEFDKVKAHAHFTVIDAMELALLTGQRPADVLKFRKADIRDGAL